MIPPDNQYFLSLIPIQGIKKLYGPFLWKGFNCLKATEPLRGSSLLLMTKFSEIPSTHLIEDGRLSRPGSRPAVLNTGPLDW